WRLTAWSRQTLTRWKEVSPSRQVPFPRTRWVTATRRLATATPLQFGVGGEVAGDRGVVVRGHQGPPAFCYDGRGGWVGGLAFWAGPLGALPGTGGADGGGDAVVLSGDADQRRGSFSRCSATAAGVPSARAASRSWTA